MEHAFPVTVAGRIGTDPEPTLAETGEQGVKFHLAVDAWQNADTNVWESTPPVWHEVVAYGNHARSYYDQLEEGDAVIVAGELRVRPYVVQGEVAKRREIVANAVGADLRYEAVEIAREHRPARIPDVSRPVDRTVGEGRGLSERPAPAGARAMSPLASGVSSPSRPAAQAGPSL